MVGISEVNRRFPPLEEELVVKPNLAIPQGGLETGHEVVPQAVRSHLQSSGSQDHANLARDGGRLEEGRTLHVRGPPPSVVVAVVVGPYDRAVLCEDFPVCDTPGKVVLKEDLAEFPANDDLHGAAKNDDLARGQVFQVDIREIADDEAVGGIMASKDLWP